MVLLTMTPSMVEALEKLRSLQEKMGASDDAKSKGAEEAWQMNEKSKDNDVDQGMLGNRNSLTKKGDNQPAEPTLLNSKVGNPISHGQVIDISRHLNARRIQPSNLEALLRGSKVYVPPPPPKAEPTSEYKTLMARLRREEEDRSYERMINQPPFTETFAQRFPTASAAHAFPSSYQNISTSDPEDDGLTYAEVDRQMTLILNVLISIVACAAAIWVVARWWDTPARLALSMSGSILVGVAEMVVYSGYIRRVGEARRKEKSVNEVQEIMKTWVVGAGEEVEDGDVNSTSIESTHIPDEVKMKQRKRETQ